jgi:hypothetical protein
MSVTFNGRSYDASMFAWYGYASVDTRSALPLFPEGIITDLLADLSAAAGLPTVAPGAAGGYVRSNGAAWARVSGLTWADRTGNFVMDFLFTDATFDIGKSGATRPRDGFFSRNVVVGGTLNVSGATSLGAVSALGTVSADLLFTDATFDIGKSAATRPRDGFFSRNVVIGGTLNVSGAITGSLTGNASTATTLQTARNINTVAFDGSADITVPWTGLGKSSGATVSCPWHGIRPYYPLNTLPSGSLSTGKVAADTVYYSPFVVGRSCTIDELGFEVTTLNAGAKGRCGIYSMHATNFGPDQLIVDAGDQDLSTTGLKVATGLSVALVPGKLYWFAYTTNDGTTAVLRVAFDGNSTPHGFYNIVGYPGAMGANAGTGIPDANALVQNRAYAALPGTAAPTGVNNRAGGLTPNILLPLILARYSA